MRSSIIRGVVGLGRAESVRPRTPLREKSKGGGQAEGGGPDGDRADSRLVWQQERGWPLFVRAVANSCTDERDCEKKTHTQLRTKHKNQTDNPRKNTSGWGAGRGRRAPVGTAGSGLGASSQTVAGRAVPAQKQGNHFRTVCTPVGLVAKPRFAICVLQGPRVAPDTSGAGGSSKTRQLQSLATGRGGAEK